MQFIRIPVLFSLLLITSHVAAETPRTTCEDYATMPAITARKLAFDSTADDEFSIKVLERIASGGTALDEQMLKNRLLLLYVAAEHLQPKRDSEISSALREAMAEVLEAEANGTSIKTLADLDRVIQATIADIKAKAPKSQPFDLSQQKLATLREKFHELLRLPQTLRRIKETVDQEFIFSQLDAHLLAHHGFHMAPGEPRFQARPWEGMTMGQIDSSQVNMNLREFLTFVIMAMEIEDPIPEYSERTGQTIRSLLPKFARFMGSTAERLQYLKDNGSANRWCEAAWCKEERRHGNAWANIYQKLTGQKPNRDNPNSIAEVQFTEDGAFAHLVSRMTTEWQASSTYLTMAHQTQGELNRLVMNITRDEIKHLIISSSAYVYLKGLSPWGRFKDIARTAWYFVTSHQEERSNGDDMISNNVRLLEAIYTHTLIELKMRKYLRTLPLSALRVIFDGQSNIKPLPVAEVSEETKRYFEEWDKDAARKRSRLLWWGSVAERDWALAQEEFENAHKDLIALVIRDEFNGFKGAEKYESAASEALRQRILHLDIRNSRYSEFMKTDADRKMWTRVLGDALRLYQIFSDAPELGQNPT